MKTEKLFLLTTILVLSVFPRLIPHPPSFTPIITVEILSGTHIENKKLSILFPLVTMFFSEFIIGFHSLITSVYFSLGLIVTSGIVLYKKYTTTNNVMVSLTATLLIYVVTNFDVWYMGSLYLKIIDGLFLYSITALPFLKNSILSSLLNSTLLFGVFELAMKDITILKEAKIEI